MSFIKKLLGRGEAQTAGRLPDQEPQPEVVSKAEYERLEKRFNNVVAKAEELVRIVHDRDQMCRELSEYTTRYLRERDTARAEAEANKADAEKYRRSRANLALGTAASAAKRKAAANG